MKPNAGFQAVVNDVTRLASNFCKEDYIIILGGTNNITKHCSNYEALESYFNLE